MRNIKKVLKRTLAIIIFIIALTGTVLVIDGVLMIMATYHLNSFVDRVMLLGFWVLMVALLVFYYWFTYCLIVKLWK